MKIAAAEIADRPPRGNVIVRAAGRRAAGEIEDRCIGYVASDPSVGRDGHTIAADAWEIADFLNNPVFLFAHDDGEPPIGKVISLRTVGNQLRAIVRYAERDIYEFADVVFRLVKGNYLNAVSTGWLPLEWKRANDPSRPGGIDFQKVQLLEISQVPVPALPTALATARSAGIDLAPFVAWTERALDSRQSLYDRGELQMVRTAAGGAKSYPSPRRPLFEPLAGSTADRGTGWRSFGEFLQAVARAESGSAPADRRLVRAPPGLAEQDPSKGGYGVPTTYLDRLVGSIYEEATIAPLCSQFETDRPAEAKLPAVDETSRVDGSRWGGSRGYWSSEADTVPANFPRFKSISFAGHKLMGVCAVTTELLSDASMLEAYVTRAFSSELSFLLDAAILSGGGAGTPLGILNGGGLITVAKGAGQPAGTITPENIDSMWSRLPAPCRRRATWLANEDVENMLSNIAGVTPTLAALYVQAGVSGNETPLLKGRPLLSIEQAPALGTPGDIVLADLTQYAVVRAPMKTGLSLDVLFSSDQGAFRFAWRVDGQPLWVSAISPYNQSGLTRSPYIALAQR